MTIFKKITPPRLANMIIILSLVTVIMSCRTFLRPNQIIAWDVVSYYAYLPATFVHHDLTLGFIDTSPAEIRNQYWPEYTKDSSRYIKTSMGMSFLYMPFFFIGHAAAYLAHEKPHGYSLPYRQALVFGALVYLLTALYFLRKLLEKYFSPTITAMVLFLTVCGTNLFYYSTFECAMPHLYNFMLLTMFAWFTIKWHERPNIRFSIYLGLIFGLITLIRPTNAIVVVFFLFWHVFSFKSLTEKIRLFIHHYGLLVLIAVFVLAVWIPQLIYWKMITGHWFFFSYGEERFFFQNPKIIAGLFSYRKGWFMYTPVMVFALAGIPLLYQKHRDFFVPILVYTLFAIYIIFSWWCWWYGGSVGCRPIIDSYGILAIPLAAFLTWMFQQKKIYQALLLFLIVFALLINVKFMVQSRTGTLHHDSMAKVVYWKSFLRFKPYDELWQLIVPPDYNNAMKGLPESEEKK